MSLWDKFEKIPTARAESSIDLILDDADEGRLRQPPLLEKITQAGRRIWAVALCSGFGGVLFRRAFQSKPLRLKHVDDAEMLAYLDGELSITVTEEVTSHLQSCWSCRSEMRTIRTQIKTFLADRDAKLPQSPSAVTDRVGELRRKLADKDK